VKINTITTIELSSQCNLACKYCVNRLLRSQAARIPMIMSDQVFEQSLLLLDQLKMRGTQRELNLNGNGEPLMDHGFLNRLVKVREVMGPAAEVQFSTNGLLMTDELARGLKAAGISIVHLSVHSPYHTRRAGHMLLSAGVQVNVNFYTIIASHNWAGQLEPQHSIPEDRLPKIPCQPLDEGRAYIQAEGDVVPCCYDYRNLGRIGSVFDADILDREVNKFSLCETCHQGK
jgi:hypothetical protein